MLTQEQITQNLKNVIYPNFSKDIVSFGFLKEVKVSDEGVYIRIDIPSSAQVIDKLRAEVQKQLEFYFARTESKLGD